MSHPTKHFLILGATGPSGLRTVEFALRRNHNVTLYARSPDKLPEKITSGERVTVVQGELHDEEKLKSCFMRADAKPIDAVLSTLGAKVGQPKGNPITAGYKLLISIMAQYSVSILVLLSTVSVSAPQDHFSVIREGLVAGIKTIGYSAWSDVVATGELMRSDETKKLGLKITLARVPTLTGGEGGTLNVGYIGEKGQKWMLDRTDLAIFFVGEAEEPKWAGEAPLLNS